MALEQLGVPSVAIFTPVFGASAAFNAEGLGFPHLPIVIIPTRKSLMADLPPEEVQQAARKILPDIEAILTAKDLRELEECHAASNVLKSSKVKLGSDAEILIDSQTPVSVAEERDGSIHIHLVPEPEDLMEYLGAQRAYDGLPVIPPTSDRVKRMLEYSLRDPDEVIVKIPPRSGAVTPRRLAACAVMAGCKPEYFPVLETAFAAMAASEFNLGGITTTTGEVWPSIIVSGPYANKIGMECGYGLLGPGNRANNTIGRTITLVLMGIAGAWPGAGSFATFGNLTRKGLAFAEDLDTPWTPLHVEKGYPDQTTITVVATFAPVLLVDETDSAENVLYMTSYHVALPGTRGAYNPGEVVVLYSPNHRERLISAGYTKEDIKHYIYENARLPYSLGVKTGPAPNRKRWPKWVYGNPYDGMFPFLRSPDDAIVMAAGAGSAAHTAIMHTWVGNHHTVTVPLKLP